MVKYKKIVLNFVIEAKKALLEGKIMKKTEFDYSKPEIELIRLSTKDVITRSGDDDDTEWDELRVFNEGSF